MWISLSLSEKWAHEIDEDAFRGSCSIKLKKNHRLCIELFLEKSYLTLGYFFFLLLEMPEPGIFVFILTSVCDDDGVTNQSEGNGNPQVINSEQFKVSEKQTT